MNSNLSARWDRLRRSFWVWPALSMLAAAVLGWAIGSLDDTVRLRFGVVSFNEPSSAREMLQTIATVTVTVIGISFSVTVVALQLASQQLGPRVLRTFQADPLNKFVLSLFLGLFVYCIVVLMTLDGGDSSVPELAVAVAIALAIVAFGSFVAFIHRIVDSLQASTLINRIAADGMRALDDPFPSGIGSEPRDPAEARLEAARRSAAGVRHDARADRAGFVATIDGERLIALATKEGLIVRQCIAIGDFAFTGTTLAELWAPAAVRDDVVERAARSFALESERTVVQDVGFPVRQLADVALRALSPSLNDPTTAENAMSALTDLLIRFAAKRPPSAVRVDGGGTPRFVACVPELDDLVRLGFDQVRVAAAGHAVVAGRLREMLLMIEDATARHAVAGAEPRRQLDLLREGGS